MIMNDIINVIKSSTRIGITFHTSPDGDALGSSIALMLGLRKIGKEAYIISKDMLPENYAFLPHSGTITGKLTLTDEDTDCVIVLDCGNVERISTEFDFSSSKCTIINIDHHLSNNLYGNLNYVDTNSAAVGEIIYQMLRSMDVYIDQEIATCLYTSIVTDTGGFRHSNTTSMTHSIVGDLINTGINFSELYRIIFEDKKFERIKLYGKVIESMELYSNKRLCIMELTKEMLSSTNCATSDTSDIISLGMQINSVEVAVLIKEMDDGVKVSLRSKSLVNVRMIAEQFNGGGHIRASGLSLYKGIKDAKEILINVLEKELI